MRSAFGRFVSYALAHVSMGMHGGIFAYVLPCPLASVFASILRALVVINHLRAQCTFKRSLL
eukprot:5620616-Pleurochrysis_carterae.AAC.2